VPTFGNEQVGDEFIHYLNGDIWGSLFPVPENGYAKSITMYVKVGNTPARLRASLYQEFVENMKKRFRFVMAAEEKTLPANFEGKVTLNFSAPPPLSQGVKYWINGWADDGIVQISSRKTPGIYQSAEWTTYMLGQPRGLGYPRFYEIIPQGIRIACICTIYCTYDLEAPTYCKCPYCGSHFETYTQVLQHIMATPIEMIHLQICLKCGRAYYLREELQLHMYQAHGIGTPPQQYSCIFCPLNAPTTKEVYDHIDALAQS